MSEKSNYIVSFIDEGNCEIATVQIGAFSPIGALARAYEQLEADPVVDEAVRKETVRVTIINEAAPITINAFEEGPIG